jgi:hypothetical protein
MPMWTYGVLGGDQSESLVNRSCGPELETCIFLVDENVLNLSISTQQVTRIDARYLGEF